MIGSNCVLQINEKRIRARQYPWGIAEVENSDHCDFKILRDMLIRTHMQVCNGHHKVKWGHKRLTSILGPVFWPSFDLGLSVFHQKFRIWSMLPQWFTTKTFGHENSRMLWAQNWLERVQWHKWKKKRGFYSGHLGQWPSELVEFGHLVLGSP